MRYLAYVRPTRTGYSADAPDVPDCIATGRTVEQARSAMAKALRMHLELLQESGERIPRARHLMPDDDTEEGTFMAWIDVSMPRNTRVGTKAVNRIFRKPLNEA